MSDIKTRTVDVPPSVVEVMAYAEKSGWWPFDAVKDIRHFVKCWTATKGKVNLYEAFIKYEAWLDDQPPKKNRKYRLGFLNWCINAKKYRDQAETPYQKPAVGNQPSAFRRENSNSNPRKSVKSADKKVESKLTPEEIEENRKDCADLLAGKITAEQYKQKWGGKI